MNNAERNQKRARFLLKVFIVRHVIGVGMLAFLTFSAFNLELNKKLGWGSAALTLVYLGVVIWMGMRLHRAGQPKLGPNA
ncbi:MAG: hypothetical protein QM758_08705 [Armatimonas sp.]